MNKVSSPDGFPKLVELDVDQANCGFLNNTRYFAGTFNDEPKMVSPFNRIKFELCDGALFNANACNNPGKSGSMTVSLLTKALAKLNRAATTSSKDYINKDDRGTHTCISFQKWGKGIPTLHLPYQSPMVSIKSFTLLFR